MTSVQDCQDADGLRNYLQNAQLKVEVRRHASYYTNLAHVDQMLQDEVNRLTGKLTRAKYLLASAIMSLKCI
jgi:endonuclease IV